MLEEWGIFLEDVNTVDLGKIIVEHPNSGNICMNIFLIHTAFNAIKNVEPHKGVHLALPANSIRMLAHTNTLLVLDKVQQYLSRQD